MMGLLRMAGIPRSSLSLVYHHCVFYLLRGLWLMVGIIDRRRGLIIKELFSTDYRNYRLL